MTDLDKEIATEEPTITVGDTTHPISELEDEVKEMLSLHQEAQQMALGAKRQAVIHDLAVANLASMIEKRLTETEE